MAVNSIALYVNMLVTMGATFLGTRFVLQALGDIEYGVYVLVADMVAMFSFLNVSMAAATQRFLSYALGEGNTDKLKAVFYNSVIIHIAIAVILMVALLALGVPAIWHWLDVPVAMHTDAMSVLMCMAVSTVFIVMAVPYEGAMNAHEDIFVIAGINIVDALLKLCAAVAVLNIKSDRLVTYALMLMSSSVVVFLLKRIYCGRHYEESHFKWRRISDFSLVREMTGFAGWNLIGAGCSLARYQGAAILVNKFFGLAANAAYGVAQQLNGFLLFFANSSVRPMRPQIIKCAGAGEHKQMVKLIHSVSRLTFLMLCMVMIPLYINMPYVLDVWLDAVPEGALSFCRGFLVLVLVSQLSVGLQIALEGSGRIKRLQMIVGSMHVLPLFAACLLFMYGFPMYVIMYCMIAEEAVCVLLRLLIARRDADVPLAPYLKHVILPTLLCALFTFVVAWQVYGLLAMSLPLVGLVVSTFVTLLLISLIGYRFCITRWEREKIVGLFTKALNKIGKRR